MVISFVSKRERNAPICLEINNEISMLQEIQINDQSFR